MTKEHHILILAKLNAIRDDMQTRPDKDCRAAVHSLCEIVGQLLCELRNVEDMASRAAWHASALVQDGPLPGD